MTSEQEPDRSESTEEKPVKIQLFLGATVAHFADGSVAVRQTKDGPQLNFSKSEWDAFIGGVKLGEFDNDK